MRSQSRIHQRYRETDGRTDGRSDVMLSQYRAMHIVHRAVISVTRHGAVRGKFHFDRIENEGALRFVGSGRPNTEQEGRRTRTR